MEQANFSFDNLVREISKNTIYMKWVNGPEKYSRTAIMTTYYAKGQLAAMKEIYKRNPETFILFIGYNDSNNGGDMQPGVTGSRIHLGDGKYEKPARTAIRELAEETGYFSPSSTLELFDTSQFSNDIGGDATVYLLDASTCEIAVNVKVTKDRSNKKISVIPYGTYTQIITMAKNAKPIDPDEKIGYYAVVPVCHAVKMLEKARTFKNRKSTFVYTI